MSNRKDGRGSASLATRFKRGNQEWRKREAKRALHEKFSPGSDVRSVFTSLVTIKVGEKTKKDFRLRGIIKKLIAEALQGNVTAANDLLSFRLNAAEIGDLKDTILILDAPGDLEC